MIWIMICQVLVYVYLFDNNLVLLWFGCGQSGLIWAGSYSVCVLSTYVNSLCGLAGRVPVCLTPVFVL